MVSLARFNEQARQFNQDYKLQIGALSQDVLRLLTDKKRIGTYFVIYNAKTNTTWVLLGLFVGFLGSAALEKKYPNLAKKVGLLQTSDEGKPVSFLNQIKDWTNHQSNTTKLVLIALATSVIFTNYYCLEGLAIGVVGGQWLLSKGREEAGAQLQDQPGYNLQLQALGKYAYRELSDKKRIGTYFVVYNAKTNTSWMLLGLFVGFLGSAVVEKKYPSLAKRAYLLECEDEMPVSLLEQLKRWLNQQSNMAKAASVALAVSVVFTPYYFIEGLAIGIVGGQWLLSRGRAQAIKEQAAENQEVENLTLTPPSHMMVVYI